MGKVVDLADRRKRVLSARQEAALDSPLPPFPEIAWRGLFGMYRDLMAKDPEAPSTPVSECPMPFHFANFLAYAAAEMGHGIRLAEGAPTYANFFIFCCGKTGTKKSTAGDLAHEYIYRLYPDVAQAFVVTSVSSGEGLIRLFSQHPQLFLKYDEGKDLFATAARNGSRIEPILNAAFNLRPVSSIVKKSKDSIEATEYFFNMLLNATPEHVLLDLSEALFKGGLLNRFLVFAAKPTDVSKARMGTPEYTAATYIASEVFKQCQAWLQTTAGQRGKTMMGYTPEASAMHEQWYDALRAESAQMSDLAASPLTRLDLYAKKLAMVYCFYETMPCDHPLITAPQMESALAVINYCRKCMEWMISAWTGQRTVWQQSAALAERRIEEYFLHHGCLSERDVYRAMHMSFEECRKVIDALVSQGIVTTSGSNPRMVHLIGVCQCDV